MFAGASKASKEAYVQLGDAFGGKGRRRSVGVDKCAHSREQ